MEGLGLRELGHLGRKDRQQVLAPKPGTSKSRGEILLKSGIPGQIYLQDGLEGQSEIEFSVSLESESETFLPSLDSAPGRQPALLPLLPRLHPTPEGPGRPHVATEAAHPGSAHIQPKPLPPGHAQVRV